MHLKLLHFAVLILQAAIVCTTDKVQSEMADFAPGAVS